MGTKSLEDHDTTKFGVHLLVIIFGITSWSIMNGLWVELPILVSHLPEGWTLPSYLTIITQFGNIGLIIFSLIAFCKPKLKLETPTSFVVVIALTLCALLYSFFWKETAYAAGDEHSLALFALTFTQSIFAATTSIAYVTFMAHLKARYMASIYIGMGFSGLIPAFAALGQGQGNVRCIHTGNSSTAVINGSTEFSKGINYTILEEAINVTSTGSWDITLAVSEEPALSVQGFFLLLFAIGLVSVASFLTLVFHPYCRSEHVDTDKEENCQLMQSGSKQDNDSAPGKESTLPKHQVSQINNDMFIPGDSEERSRTGAFISDNTLVALQSLDPLPKEDTTSSPSEIHQVPQDPGSRSPPKHMHYFYELKTINSLENGDMSDDVQTSVPNNDDNEDEIDFKSSKKGKQITKLESWYLLGLLVWINALQTSFVLAIQVYSSLPYGLQFYHGATKAENIVDPVASFLTFWITARSTRVISCLTLLGTVCTAYIILVAALSPNPFLLHETAGGALVVTAWVLCTMLMVFSKVSIASVMRSQGRLSLMWTGASTQLGSLIGAIVAYVTINVLHLFKDEPWCR